MTRSRRVALATPLVSSLVAIALLAGALLAGALLASGCGGPANARPPAADATRHDLAAFASEYVRQRALAATKGADLAALRGMYLPGSPLADLDLWRARGVAALAARRYNVRDLSIDVRPLVRRVTVAPGGRTATVVVFSSVIMNRWSDDVTQGYDAVDLSVSGGHWYVSGDRSSVVDRALPAELAGGGAPANAVAAARRDLRSYASRVVPAGVTSTLRRYCAALNRKDDAAVKRLFTADSAVQKAPALGDSQQRSDWHLVRAVASGGDVPGVCTAWVTLSYKTPLPAADPGARGARTLESFELQPDGRWLIFAPALPGP